MPQITIYYPHDILKAENELRSIKILVKEQKSISGGINELKKQIEKTSNDIKKIYESITTNKISDSDRRKTIHERTKKLTQAKTLFGIALPLPNELSDSQSHKWETTEGFVGKQGKNLIDKGGINSIIGELSSTLGTRKPMIDPGFFQDYNGTEPRSFTFSWDLIPDNLIDAESIHNIIYHLKKFTLPTTTINGISLLSPYIFDIEIGNAKINQMLNINNVVCTSMTVNYAAEGALQFFSDGTPKFIKLDMTFIERSTITSDLF
jgi:hypothetical protein